MNSSFRHARLALVIVTFGLFASVPAFGQAALRLDALDLSGVEQEWGNARANRSVDNNPLTLGGRKFEHGIGTHAESTFNLSLNGHASAFRAQVGVDDEVGAKGSVVFKVMGDGKTLWESGLMHGGDAAKAANVQLDGVRNLTLLVENGGDDINYDHADWADAEFVLAAGLTPQTAGISAPVPPKEEAIILTPKPSPRPQINGAKVFGVRPGSPFLFTIAATGDRPMTFSAGKLPAGLTLDPETGHITGMLEKKGEYRVTLGAKNKLGTAKRQLKIVCGSQIGLTPAMGWNSWNCFAGAVTAERVKAAADAMVKSGLVNHGWQYINIDDFWEVNMNAGRRDPTLAGPERDAQGRILPNPRFPDMKGLADYVHAQGLKIGIYSSPGPTTCGGCVASWKHEEQDAQSYANWGIDYLKYDWCSYGQIARDQGDDSSIPALQKPYLVMRAALDKVPRDILYSLCQYGMGNVWEWGATVGGNSWRTTGDITDTWNSLSRIGFSQAGHEKFAGPGHFNDPDMMIIGHVGWGPRLHPTRLTPNEQYTHVSLWCLLASPLLIGCDMTQMDDFTLSLLTNDEVLAVDQDPLGHQAGRVAKESQLEVWARDLEDGSKAVGLFNRGPAETNARVNWPDLGLKGKHVVRDLWRQKDIGKFSDHFEAMVPRHGVVLVKISK